MGTALEKNFDVRIAAERVLEARAQYGITRANLLPTLDATGSFTASRSSSIGSFPFIAPGTNLATSYTQAGLQLSWELDLWGRLRRLNEAARAQYLATEEARNGVVISLIADVMNTYFALRELDLELDIGQQNNGIARDNLRLIQLRKDRGAANGLEVHQAEQFLYTTTAQIASVQRSIAQTEDALNLLLANAPSQVPRGETLEQIASPPELPAGLPASLHRAAARYSASRAESDCGQRADRRGASAVPSGYFAHGIVGQPKPVASGDVQRSGARGIAGPGGGAPDLPCGPARRRAAD